MSNRRDPRDRADHLRSGVIFLVTWLGVVIAVVYVLKDGGIFQKLSKFREGEVFPLLLISASVILLAVGLRSFFLYFQGAGRHEDQDS